MMAIVFRLLLSALALYLMTQVYGGVYFEPGSTWVNVLLTALVMGIVNTLVRPILLLLTLPINVLTLGLFTLVVNALVLMIVAALTTLNVTNFSAALVGGLVLAFINWLIELIVPSPLAE